jgi:hypothetical protein
MHTRGRLASFAAFAIPSIFISFALWHGLAPQTPAIDRTDCNPRDPLSSCAAAPQVGTPVGDGLVYVGGPELQSAGGADQSLAVVRFAANASPAAIKEFLDASQASVIAGPKDGGLYTLLLLATGEAKRDLIKQMQAQSAIVEFIASVQ